MLIHLFAREESTTSNRLFLFQSEISDTRMRLHTYASLLRSNVNLHDRENVRVNLCYSKFNVGVSLTQECFL